MLIFVALFLVLLSSLFLISSSGIRPRPAYLLAWFLAAYAQVVLIAELASLLRALTLPFFLAAHLLILAAAFFFWRKRGSPSLWGPFHNLAWSAETARAWLKAHPLLSLWAAATAMIYLVQAAVILRVPPNNFDSMTYHLSRVAYWLQHASLFPWPTPNPRQTTFPMNAEIGVLWTMLFSGGDQWAGFVQWLSAGVIVLAIFATARLLGASRSQSLFAGLLFACFPGILLQSNTTQNDMVVSAFFACALYFLLLARRQNALLPLILSGGALGLALGAKTTVVFILPAYALAAAIDLLISRFLRLGFYLRWAGLCVAGFLLFAALGYAQNQIVYRDPFSDPAWTDTILNVSVSRAEMLAANTALYGYQLLDLTGLPQPLAAPLTNLKASAGAKLLPRLPLSFDTLIPDRSLANILRMPPVAHEDTSWYGLLGFLVLLPAVLWQGIAGIRRRQPECWMLALLALGFLLAFSLLNGWTPYKGRYFILPTAVAAPLTFAVYTHNRLRPHVWLIAALSVFIAVTTLLTNPTKPLIGPNAIWGKSRQELRTLSNPAMRPVIEMIDQHVPADGTLATRLGQDDWDYPLFGEDLTRRVLQDDPRIEQVDAARLREMQAGYLLVSPLERTFISLPAGLEQLAETDGWLLFRVLSEGQSAAPRVYDTASDLHNLVFLNPTMQNQVSILDVTSREWDVESADGQGIFWMGERAGQGLHIFVWAQQAGPVTLTYQLQPGPARTDIERTLDFRHLALRGYLELPMDRAVQRINWDGAQPVTVTADLHAGLNELSLYCLDDAQIRQMPNGDQRPLLLRVNRVDVNP